jgi:predicted Zn-dependent protease with MMP-like domain
MKISHEQFEKIVAEALDAIPDEFMNKIHNVAIMVEDFPSEEQMKRTKIKSKYGLLGLYEGHIQSRRINIGPVLPDRITIFRVPIMKSCDTNDECRDRIINTVRHEIAHHFGSDEKGARQAAKTK